MVRTLLSWFFASYRTKYTIRQVEAALNSLSLKTEPHFNWTYLDGVVTFKPEEKQPSEVEGEPSPQKVTEAKVAIAFPEVKASVSVDAFLVRDPTYRIGRLDIANRSPVSVKPDTTVMQAVTLMLMHDFSQLPVMCGERTVKGLFSWKSLGSRVSQGCACEFVREAMDEYCEQNADASLWQAIALLQEHDCILIRDADKITGIMTPYDISVTFGQLAKPFLLLDEIENRIRNLIRGKLTREELAEVRDPADSTRTIDGVEDLTFGEYVRLLENPNRWEKLGLQIERSFFIKDLDEVRRIRNEVMHFDPEGTQESDLEKLRKFDEFLQRLEKIKSR